MKNILNKKLNRKGFTLAELLIVVAIIAILVAIALPLFFGALDDAKKQAFEANKRSLKAAGVTYILEHRDTLQSGDMKYKITGIVSENGDISKVKVEAVKSNADTSDESKYETYKYGETMTVYADDVTFDDTP